jgi:HEAT repeat protein
VTPADRRRRAVLAGHSGDEDTARAALGDEDASVRAGALGALERIGVLDEAALAAALSDADPTVRRRAAEIAARHPNVSLLGALHDPDERVIEMAAFSCGEQERPAASVVDRLRALAGDHPDPLVREAAVAALGAIGAPSGLDAILHAAAHDKAAVRRRAVIALAPFDGPEVDDAIAHARTDRDWQVRQVAEDLEAP